MATGIAVIFAVSATAFSAQERSGGMSRESLALVRQDHAYGDEVPGRDDVAAHASSEAVLMEVVVVTESIKQRDLQAKIERESQKHKAEQFSFTRGGVLYQKGRLQVGCWGDKNGLGILKFSW